MYPHNICRVDTNYADPEFEICRMPTLEDDDLQEDNFSWEDYRKEDE